MYKNINVVIHGGSCMKQAYIWVILMFTLLLPYQVQAAEYEDKTPVDPVYDTDSYGKYKDGGVYYDLDIIVDSEETGVTDWMFNPFDTLSGEGAKLIDLALFKFVDGLFLVNIFLTNVLIGIMKFALDSSNILNQLIDKVANTVAEFTGISGGNFSSTGLYGGTIGVICIIVVIYALWQFVTKREKIAAFGTIAQSIIAFTIALLIFSNFSGFLQGVNSASNDLSLMLVPEGQQKETTAHTMMYDNIFNSFVHVPYLMLQYSTTNEATIGQARIEELLLKKPNSQERNEIAEKEIEEYGNYTLHSSNLVERLIFVCIALVINAFNSIPVLLLALSIILCQFWFMLLAMVAPFALLWSALPEQFGVLKRYFFELCIPLFIKIGLVIMTIFLFGLTEIIYGLNTLDGSLIGFITAGVLQFMMLLTLFILRKRIFDIFSKGSVQLNQMRESFASGKEKVLSPVKKSVEGAGTLAGAVAGGVIAGPQGAIFGANIGNTAGKAITGQAGVGESVQRASITAYAMKKSMDSQQVDKLGNKVKPNFFQQVTSANMSSNEKESHAALKELGLDESTANETLLGMRRQGLNNLSAQEVTAAVRPAMQQAAQDNNKLDPHVYILSTLQGNQRSEKYEGLYEENGSGGVKLGNYNVVSKGKYQAIPETNIVVDSYGELHQRARINTNDVEAEVTLEGATRLAKQAKINDLTTVNMHVVQGEQINNSQAKSIVQLFEDK